MSATKSNPANRSPVPALPLPLASLASRLYALAINRRNHAFDRSRNVTRLDIPVISVGNLSVGGTGKTPAVERIVRTLAAAGHRPCVAMRGYRSVEGKSDEAEQYRATFRDLSNLKNFPDIPIVAQPDRIAGIRRLTQTRAASSLPPIDAIVLDDGFQHRKLARDLDLVLIDATRDPFEDHLLPRGWLREPISSLARAHAIIITRADLIPQRRLDALHAAIAHAAPKALIAQSSHRWIGLDLLNVGTELDEPVDWLKGKRLVACCAIGNPGAFLQQIANACGTAPVEALILRDHDPFTPATVRTLINLATSSRADAIITTPNDRTKLSTHPPGQWPCPVVRPVLDMVWLTGGEALEALLLQAVAPRRTP
jgi:tetraacyldisaccharide 4'-kinase